MKRKWYFVGAAPYIAIAWKLQVNIETIIAEFIYFFSENKSHPKLWERKKKWHFGDAFCRKLQGKITKKKSRSNSIKFDFYYLIIKFTNTMKFLLTWNLPIKYWQQLVSSNHIQLGNKLHNLLYTIYVWWKIMYLILFLQNIHSPQN